MQNNDTDFSLEKPSQSGHPRRPLAERMRPQTLGEIVGQNHILGEGCLLPNLIKENRVSNILLAGPPGSGKTTLASVIAEEGGCKLLKVNAVTSNAAELRETLKLVRYYGSENCFLFVDELHRFNKAQLGIYFFQILKRVMSDSLEPRLTILDTTLSIHF